MLFKRSPAGLLEGSLLPLFDRWSIVHLGSILLFSLGSSIVTPFFGIYIAKTLGFGVGFAALLISLKVISQRALSILGGVLTDALGAKSIALLGIGTRLLAFAILLFPADKSALMLSAILNGLGSAIYHPALRKLIFGRFQKFPQLLSGVVSLRNAALNLGAAVGPLLGLLIAESNFRLAFYLIVFIYAANAILLAMFRDENKAVRNLSFLKSWRDLISPIFLRIIVLQLAFFWLYSHFELLMPIFFNDRFGSAYVALAFLTNTCTVLIVQLTFSKKASFIPPCIGFAAFFLFFCICGSMNGPTRGSGDFNVLAATGVVTAMLCFSLGEIILSNRVDFMISSGVSSEVTATAFGLAAFTGGIALGAANFINTMIAESSGITGVWFFNGAIALLFLIGSLIKRKS